MYILGIDSAGKSASAAIIKTDSSGNAKLLYESFSDSGLTHSVTLLPMIDELYTNTGIEKTQTGLIAVSRGPGSFTGVRIGVCLAKGMADALGLPAAGVSSLEAAAVTAVCHTGIIAAVMDARRSHFYTAFFRSDGLSAERLTQDAALSAEEIKIFLEKNEKDRVLLVGDGAEICYNLMDGCKNVSIAPSGMIRPRGSAVALLGLKAFEKGLTVKGNELNPVYLRLPQAERERINKLKEETEQ